MNCIPAMLLFIFYFISLLRFERCHYMTMMDSFCQYQNLLLLHLKKKKEDTGRDILENTCTKHASTARLRVSVVLSRK